MTLKTFKSLSIAASFACIAPLTLIAPIASAGESCHCVKRVSSITTEKVGTVSVYRGPAVSYNYVAAERSRQNDERARMAKKERQADRRAREAQNSKIDRLEGKIDALSARTEQTKTRRNIYGYGRSYRGNNRFFGRNGFIGNSNFSGATVRLPNRGHRNAGKRRGGK